MKAFKLVIFLLPLLAAACGEANSVSRGYLETLKSADGQSKKDEKKDESKGDATAGQKIIDTTCKTCHLAGGLAKDVTLDSSAISRLDAAITGENKANHTAFKENFEGDKRKDLEAALAKAGE